MNDLIIKAIKEGLVEIDDMECGDVAYDQGMGIGADIIIEKVIEVLGVGVDKVYNSEEEDLIIAQKEQMWTERYLSTH